MTAPTIGSLFTGYGGLDLAAAQFFGAETAWTSDIEPGACSVISRRFPGVPNLGDISAVEWSKVSPVDILTGGFPCQDLSAAGKRAGMTGDRSGLWSHMATAVNELRPRLVIIENVRGILSTKAHSDLESCPECLGRLKGKPPLRALGVVLGDLADIGYDAQWVGLRAAEVGAPHNRFRVFITANPRGETFGERSGLRSGESERLRRGRPDNDDSPRYLLSTPTARDYKHPGNADRAGRLSDPRRALNEQVAHLLPTPSVSDGGGGHVNRSGARQGEFLLGGISRLLPTPRATDGTKGGPNQHGSSGDPMLPSAVQVDRWGDYAEAIEQWEAETRPAPPPTMPGRTAGSRVLNPVFVEWMQGLPEGWVTDADIPLRRAQQLKILGNGVVPQQAYEALARLESLARQ